MLPIRVVVLQVSVGAWLAAYTNDYETQSLSKLWPILYDGIRRYQPGPQRE